MDKEKLEQAIDAWFRENMADSPVSRDGQVWNHAFEAKEKLKVKLAEALGLKE